MESEIKEVSEKDSKEETTEDNAKVEEDKTEEKNGCHIQHMAGYVNNSEIFEGDVHQDKTETAGGDVEESVEKKDFSLEQMLFTEETESEKEEQMKVIGTSLTISKLEDDLDVILTKKLKVKNTEERIKRLKSVIDMLQGVRYEKEDKNNTNHDADEKTSTNEEVTKKKMEIERKKEEKVEKNSLENTSEISGDVTKQKEEKEEESIDNSQMPKTEDRYIKTSEEKFETEQKEQKDREKEFSQVEERNEQKEVYPVEKTKDNESEQKETEIKTSKDEKSGNDQKYINNEELQGSDDKRSEEDDGKEKNEEKLVTSEENEDGKEDENT